MSRKTHPTFPWQVFARLFHPTEEQKSHLMILARNSSLESVEFWIDPSDKIEFQNYAIKNVEAWKHALTYSEHYNESRWSGTRNICWVIPNIHHKLINHCHSTSCLMSPCQQKHSRSVSEVANGWLWVTKCLAEIYP